MYYRNAVVCTASFLMTMLVTNLACQRNTRFAACDEIEAASKLLAGPDAKKAIATLRTHARSKDAFVRTRAVSIAGEVGPELNGVTRAQCMDIVGVALRDPSGYVLHRATYDIGQFGRDASPYIETLLDISIGQHATNADFALESLGRIGVGHPEVGNRLIDAITEQYPVPESEEYPYRFTSLRALQSWGDKALPWLPQLRAIRDSLKAQQSDQQQAPTEQHDGPTLWAIRSRRTDERLLTRIIEALEGSGDKSLAAPSEAAE